MIRDNAGDRARQAFADASPSSRTLIQAVAAAGLGLLVGLAFSLPVFAYLLAARHRRTIMLLLAAILAILIIRRSGRLLRVLLDASPRPWRLPLLGLYGLAAMALPASLLLLQPLAGSIAPGSGQPLVHRSSVPPPGSDASSVPS